jgi:alkyl sulfatase BDS1-like metallo-beta-lactamase superfamily hydrolase
VYLTGAYELRHGPDPVFVDPSRGLGLLELVPISRFFDAMATRLDASKAEDVALTLNFVFDDLAQTIVVNVENSVLHHWLREPDPNAAATVHLTRGFLLRLATQQAGLRDLIFSDELSVEGSRLDVMRFFAMLERPTGGFNIVTP